MPAIAGNHVLEEADIRVLASNFKRLPKSVVHNMTILMTNERLKGTQKTVHLPCERQVKSINALLIISSIGGN